MSAEPPYPGPGPAEEPVVTYSLRDIIDQINRKLDVLTTSMAGRFSDLELRLSAIEHRPPPMANGEVRMSAVETRLERHDTRIDAIEKVQDQGAGGQLKVKAIMAWIGVSAAVFGAIVGAAGVVVGIALN